MLYLWLVPLQLPLEFESLGELCFRHNGGLDEAVVTTSQNATEIPSPRLLTTERYVCTEVPTHAPNQGGNLRYSDPDRDA
jgi:hypothetical protein